MKVNIISFGFSKGIPEEITCLFDARILPNPYHVPELKVLDGRDSRVQSYVMDHPRSEEILSAAADYITAVLPLYEEQERALVIGFGCYGGHHRSVSMAERLSALLAEKGIETGIVHRDLEKTEE